MNTSINFNNPFYKHWTSSEVIALKKMLDRGKSCQEAAQILGRPIGSVTSARGRMLSKAPGKKASRKVSEKPIRAIPPDLELTDKEMKAALSPDPLPAFHPVSFRKYSKRHNFMPQ